MESKSKISLPWHKKPEKKFDKPLLANPPNPPLGPAVSWVDVESRFDKPSVDLAKIFAKKNTSTADVTSKVERLLNLGANPNLVICTIRTEKNELILQPVDAKPGEGLTEAFWWHTVGTESTLFAFCVPLLEVARSGNIDTIQLFSRHGACINKVIERVISCGHSTKLLLNPFLGPYSMDRLKAVLTLIEPGQPLIYKWAATGVKLGLELGPQHDLEFVRLLLTAGAIPSGLSSPQRIAPRTMDLAVRRSIVPATLSEEQPDLINAAWKDDVQACNDALSRDPNTEIRGAFGMTALIISVGGLSSAPICRLLLDRGAAVDTFDVFGMTPLMEAIYYGHREAVMSLLDCGADVHYRIKGEPLTDFVGGTPTTYFRQESWLVQRNINARMCKTSGWNAVHMAAHRGFTELLAVLVRHGAVLEVKDVGGYTPLDLAVKNGHGATADFILRVRGSPAGKSDLRDLHSIVGGSMLSIRDRESNPLQQDDWAPKVSTRIHVDPETGSDNNSEIKTAQENPQICPRCAKAFKSGNFDVVRTFNSTFCRFCIMLNSDKWATELSHVDHVKDSNMTYVRFFEPGGSEVSLHRVRKVPQLWHSLLGRVNSLDDANTGSPAAMLMAMGWHANCIHDHTKCKPGSSSGYFPTRVLDIRSSSTLGRVRLLNDWSLREPYVALSHRWGTESLPTTIRDNIRARLEGLDMADLSPTMRDAVLIASSLHYNYIWIDALCIVQDSEEDWLSEASQMSNVFSNAAVTIAVADSVEHSQGIFRPRQPDFTRPFRIPYFQERPYRERADFDGEGEYYLFPDTQEVRSRGPLDTRGWILQEQLLSPSILYFDQGEIFWDCITATASESSPISASLLSETDPDEAWALKYIRRMIAGSENYDTRRTQISDAWLEIVKNYSNRELTKVSDRLIALQGIIAPLKQILNEDPVAGMWRSQLWRQLTWWTESPLISTQAGFSAPSWSWLSVPRRVYYHNSLLGEHPEHNTVVHKYTDLRSFSFMVDHAKSTHLDGTAGVTGSISVTAKSFSYRLTPMDLKKPVYRRWHAARLKLNTGRWMLDRPVDVPVDIQCLIVAEDAVAKSLVCLCIVPDAKRQGMWRRIGLCHWDGLAWQIPSFIGTTPETGTFTLV